MDIYDYTNSNTKFNLNDYIQIMSLLRHIKLSCDCTWGCNSLKNLKYICKNKEKLIKVIPNLQHILDETPFIFELKQESISIIESEKNYTVNPTSQDLLDIHTLLISYITYNKYKIELVIIIFELMIKHKSYLLSSKLKEIIINKIEDVILHLEKKKLILIQNSNEEMINILIKWLIEVNKL